MRFSFLKNIAFHLHSVAFTLCVVLMSMVASAQSDTLIGIENVDSISLPKSSGFKAKWNLEPHSPLKATVYSAVLPGAGQIYNKKWWKSIIVYAGLGTCVYFIQDNNQNYKLYRKAYIATIDNNPATNPEIEGNSAFFNEWQEQYRRWRDVSYMALIGVYILQIIDANVDGHLFYYDISPEISLSIHPSFQVSDRVNGGIGLMLNF